MDENEQNPQPAETDPPADPDLPPAAQATAVEPARTPWRQRVLGIRGIASVALAGLILGGAGGAAITAATSDDKDHQRDGEHRYGESRFGGPAFPDDGQMVPPPDLGTPASTAPEDESGEDS